MFPRQFNAFASIETLLEIGKENQVPAWKFI